MFGGGIVEGGACTLVCGTLSVGTSGSTLSCGTDLFIDFVNFGLDNVTTCLRVFANCWIDCSCCKPKLEEFRQVVSVSFSVAIIAASCNVTDGVVSCGRILIVSVTRSDLVLEQYTQWQR